MCPAAAAAVRFPVVVAAAGVLPAAAAVRSPVVAAAAVMSPAEVAVAAAVMSSAMAESRRRGEEWVADVGVVALIDGRGRARRTRWPEGQVLRDTF